jgi:transposase
MFRPYEPDQTVLFPVSPRDWLPENHLAFFVAETVDQLDLRDLLGAYRPEGKGELPYHPAMMLKVLIYGYCTGVFSSRKIAGKLVEDVAFRYLAAGQFPNHRTLCRFRERHLEDFEQLFVQIVQIAQEAGLVRMGKLAIDGTKVKANASKHKAMSYGRMQEEEKRLKEEIGALTQRAKRRDTREDARFGPDFRGDEVPEELQRRESRLRTIRDAKRRLEKRKAAEAAEAGKSSKKDKNNSGRPPQHPPEKPKPKDQENFTDPDSRIMKDGSGAFQQSYNAQVSVDGEEQVIVAADVVQTAADSHQLLPMLEQACTNTEDKPARLLADAGYRSEENLQELEQREIDAYVALGREGRKVQPNREHQATCRMKRKLATKRGRRRYRERKHIVEPAIGWIKQVLGFRAFSLRGLAKVSGEWKLVAMAANLRRMQHKMGWT